MDNYSWVTQLLSSVDVKDVRKPEAGDTVDSHSLRDWNLLRAASKSRGVQHVNLDRELDAHIIDGNEDMDAYPEFMAVGASDDILRDFGYDEESCIPPVLQAVFSMMTNLAAKPYVKPLINRLGLKTIDDYITASSSSFGGLVKDANAFGANPDDNAVFDEWVHDMNAGHMLNPKAFVAVRDVMKGVFGDDWNSRMDADTRSALMDGGRMLKTIRGISLSDDVIAIIGSMGDEKQQWDVIRNAMNGNSGFMALGRILSGELGEDLKALFANDIPHATEFTNMMMSASLQYYYTIQAADWAHDIILEQYGMYEESGYDMDVYEIRCKHVSEMNYSNMKYEFLMAENKLGMHDGLEYDRLKRENYTSAMGIYDSKSCSVMKEILDETVAAYADSADDGMRESFRRILSHFAYMAFDNAYADMLPRAVHAISTGRRNGVGYMDSCIRLDALYTACGRSFKTVVPILDEWLQPDYKDYPIEFIIEMSKTKNGNDGK